MKKAQSAYLLPVLLAFGAPHLPTPSAAPGPKSVTVPFVSDNNRIFVELTFALPDGTARKTLAFVDCGDPDFEFSQPLVEALEVDKGKELSVRLGDLPLRIDEDVQAAGFEGQSMVTGLEIESNLPSKVLRHYTVVLDYGKRTLTLAEPGTLKLDGTRVPMALNPKTGLLKVEATVGGRAYPMAIDNGAAYTWISQEIVGQWTQEHPSWQRGVGAVGHANMNGSAPEFTGVDVRLPSITLGALNLEHVGALGVLPGWDPKTTPRFFDWYSQKTPGPVVGFIGGNVLKAFRLTIDYAGGATYWFREQPDDEIDADQVGITLGSAEGGKYSVVQIVKQGGRDSVAGILPGDVLLSVDGWATTGETRGKVLDALHGKPGDLRKLQMSRRDREFVVTAKVTHF